jgi:hypothetical protein
MNQGLDRSNRRGLSVAKNVAGLCNFPKNSGMMCNSGQVPSEIGPMKTRSFRQSAIALAVLFGIIVFSQSALLPGEATAKPKVTSANRLPAANAGTDSIRSNPSPAGNDSGDSQQKREKGTMTRT